MNFLHMKYAVEIADTRSLNKAAEKLFVGQSNLSRSVKELETSLGITIFERSARGMTLTPDGEEFIKYARNILRQVSDIENMFSRNNISRKRLSVSVPRASYIGSAFARFSSLYGGSAKMKSNCNLHALMKRNTSPRIGVQFLSPSFCRHDVMNRWWSRSISTLIT